MKSLVLVLSLVVAAFADVSELGGGGYNYNRPSGGLGSSSQPSGSYLPGSSTAAITQPSSNYIPASGSNNYAQSATPSGSYIPASGSNNYAQSATLSGSYIPASSSNNYASPSNSYIPASQSGSNNYAHSASPSGSYIPPSGSNSFGTPSGSYLPGGGAGGNGHNPNQIQEQKHVYFYAAPDDEGQARLKINVAPSSNKNTKIIFIKAPSSGGIVPEIISPPSSMEDKTLVYVLSKKQDQGGAITIPSALGVKQAKPEVYFIKYKNQGEAEKAVSESLGGHPAGSSLPDLHDQQAFVRTIKDTPQHGIGDNLGGGSSILGSGGFGGPGGIGGGLGGNGNHGFGGSGGNGLGGSGLGNSGLGGSGSGYNYGPPGGSGPY